MKKLFPLFVFLISLQLFAQEDAWVYLKDKPNSATYLATPLTMLSQRALDRRTRQNIVLDSKDVPVDASYYSLIKSATGITILAKSKWLNAIHVQGTQTDINNLKSTFSFVDLIEFANNSLNAKAKVAPRSSDKKNKNKFAEINTTFNYGTATNQITMLKGDFLHQEGYSGSGMQIAVIDAGFPNVDALDAFKRLRDNNQILGGYDFVNRNTNFYAGHNHGTNVLSDIGGYIDGEFVGTAPDASFYLFITEDANNEVPLEESLWVEAAERADSLGVDVINTSLGYTTFDNANYNYSYADMDGKTAFISR
ncbi:MAG: S8 family serine peptidase, partial [Flavobacteriaceae bacterium]|nr:S8 family serine peptidase [Flavobacteriaceae bacterium]